MNIQKGLSAIFVVALPVFISCSQEESSKKITAVDFSKVKIEDSFWAPRLDKHFSATLPVCIDQIENQTGRIRNFENAAKGEGKHSGIFFDDSDVYKAMEGIAYTLVNHPDAAVLFGKFIADGPAAVGRPVVHQDDFQIGMGLIQDGLDTFGQILLHLVDGDNHADKGIFFHLITSSRRFPGKRTAGHSGSLPGHG